MQAGLFRPLTLWPFPIRALLPLLGRARRIVVVEASEGQLEDELRLALSPRRRRAAPPSIACPPLGGVLPSPRRDRRQRVKARMSVFYETFERHADGEGLKAHSTHYCPGCGHGLVHKYLAEAIEDARHAGPHGGHLSGGLRGVPLLLPRRRHTPRPPTAARRPSRSGHKLAHPESIVVSYQGDGDLASIGLAEILQAAQLGLPITVLFVNNAIYGMTGGQMAPTTLMGQQTATTPDGRDAARAASRCAWRR